MHFNLSLKISLSKHLYFILTFIMFAGPSGVKILLLEMTVLILAQILFIYWVVYYLHLNIHWLIYQIDIFFLNFSKK